MQTEILKLKSGVEVLVDPGIIDACRLQSYRWYIGSRGKVCCNQGTKRTPLYLSRLITGATESERVLHLDGNNLNCRLDNLFKQKIQNIKTSA